MTTTAFDLGWKFLQAAREEENQRIHNLLACLLEDFRRWADEDEGQYYGSPARQYEKGLIDNARENAVQKTIKDLAKARVRVTAANEAINFLLTESNRSGT